MKVWFGMVCLLVPGAMMAQAQTRVQAQVQVQQQVKVPAVVTTVVVVGTPDPVAEEESARSTRTLDAQAGTLSYTDLNDLLRGDTSVALEERGGGGVQADVTIRGGSFEQTLVLLNGLRINDAETSHFNLDVPVVKELMGSVNVLHGAGSTLYGSDAVSGVVDFETAVPREGAGLKLRAAGGSYGDVDDAVAATFGGKAWSEAVGGERDRSDGFIADRDYRSEEASSEIRFASFAGKSDVLLAGSDRAFGANQFYGAYESFERTKGWFAAVNQQVDAKTQAALAFRRHTDIFVLLRNAPGVYKNQHIDTSWQGAVRRRDDLPWKGAAVFYGLEEDADQIQSTNLGRHGRNRGAGYVDFELRKAWGTISAGEREEVFGGGPVVSTPTVAGSVWVKRKVKLRASAARGFRQPTYTDLYYSDPTTVGNAALKPESEWSFDGGADWYVRRGLTVSATVFHSLQKDAIDYVRLSPAQKWQAENLDGVRFTGSETAVDWRPRERQELKLGLTTLLGSQAVLNGLESEYMFNYPVQNGSAEWVGRWKNGLMARQRVRVGNWFGRGVAPVWDASAVYERGRVQPYVQATNLSNTGYQEIVGVPMQGRGFLGGVQVELRRGK